MTKERDLAAIVKDLTVNQKRASYDLETAPWQTRASLSNMVQDAKAEVKALKTEYTRRVRSNSFGVFVFGSKERVKRFAELAEAEAGMFVVSASALYESLATKINPSFGTSREFGANQLAGLHEGLKDFANALDLSTRVKTPDLATLTHVKDYSELVDYIRALVRTTEGDNLVSASVDDQINKSAIEAEYTGKMLPVVVTGMSQEEVSTLTALFTNAATVELGDEDEEGSKEITKEFVLEKLTSLRAKLKLNNNKGK